MGKPTHYLSLRERDNHDNKRAVGSAWFNPEHGGYFSIQLNLGVTLSWRDMKDCQLALFPTTDGRPVSITENEANAPKPSRRRRKHNDEVPF